MLIRSTVIAASLILLLTGCARTVDTASTAFVPITYRPQKTLRIPSSKCASTTLRGVRSADSDYVTLEA